MKTINRYVPEKAYDFIKQTNYKNKEHLYIILDMINRITIFHKEDKDYSNNFIDIPISYFKDIIQNKDCFKESMDFLKSTTSRRPVALPRPWRLREA
jgi:hypothetical protein